MTEPAATTKTLGPHDFRFVCVACWDETMVASSGGYHLANEYVGALGWLVLARCDRDPRSKGGLVCPKCVPAQLPAEAAAVA